MPDKDVDEQFAAIMAHWQEDALGLDPSGDPKQDSDRDGHTVAGSVDDGRTATPSPGPGPELVSDPQGGPHDERRASEQPSERVDWEEAAPREDSPQTVGPEAVAPLVGSSWREHRPHEEDLHFEPPPPAPLPPAEDKHFWTMLSALVGGPLLFLYLLLFNRDGNGWWMTFAILVSVAGFVLLVLRQPAERDEGDDGVRL